MRFFNRRFITGVLFLILFHVPVCNAMAPDSSPFSEQIVVLETLGLHFSQDEIERLESSHAELVEYIPDFVDRGKFTDYPQMLSLLGSGEFDPETWRYLPRAESVYSFDMECMNIVDAYHDVLLGIAFISKGEITIEDYESHIDDEVFEVGIGEQRVDFVLNGRPYSFTASFQYDWLDPDILDYVNSILAQQSMSKRIWFMPDQGQGLVLFYNDQTWANEFQEKTGYQLYPSSLDDMLW